MLKSMKHFPSFIFIYVLCKISVNVLFVNINIEKKKIYIYIYIIHIYIYVYIFKLIEVNFDTPPPHFFERGYAYGETCSSLICNCIWKTLNFHTKIVKNFTKKNLKQI